MKFESSRLVLGLFLEAIALCLITSLRFINIESTVTLLIFNLLLQYPYLCEGFSGPVCINNQTKK
jgi:hypothetical protein